MSQSSKVRVVMVCLGNICRSPTAEAMFRQRAEHAGLAHLIEVDSSGTSDWHIGEAPDRRSQQAAKRRGYDLSTLRGRQAIAEDFDQFDYVLAMDEQNLRHLQRMCPEDYKGQLALFLDYGSSAVREVPDPYHGGSEGFETVLDLIEDASEGLLEDIRDRHLAG